MADHGTVVLVSRTVMEVTNYGVPTGATPPPTTGQIWPRGNP